MKLAVAICALAGCGRMGFDATRAAGAPDGRSSDGGTTTNDGANAGDGAAMMADAPPGSGMANLVADTYLQGVSTGPWGSATGLIVGRSQTGGTNQFSLFQFDVSGYSATVTSATLQLYQYASMGTSAMTIEVHRETQAWDEPTADWSLASTGVNWTSGGGGTMDAAVTASLPITPGVYQTYSWDVTALVNAWITGTPNYGLELVYQTQPPTGNNITFASREHATTAWRPQLVIVP